MPPFLFGFRHVNKVLPIAVDKKYGLVESHTKYGEDLVGIAIPPIIKSKNN